MYKRFSLYRFWSAFTIAEILVTVVTLGVLVILAIPAIQIARESARRSQCGNNIRRLALGVLSYHESNQSLPLLGCCSLSEDKLPVGTKQKYRYPRINSIAALMPYFEQSEKGQNILSVWESDDHYNSIAQVTEAFPVMGVQIPILRCPSDLADSYPDTESGSPLASRSYVYCSGDWPEAGIYQYVENQDGYKVLTEMSLEKIQSFNNNTRTGIPSCWPYRRLSDIADGLSNTVLMSEKTLGKPGSRSVKESSLLLPTAVPSHETSPETEGKPGECLNSELRSNQGWTPAAGSLDTGISGVRAYDAIPQYSTFSTILPPNSPMCQSAIDDRVLHSATSYHSGGVIVAFYDGSVRFISDSIGCNDFEKAKIKKAGNSEFGLWGNLGSICDGHNDLE